MVQAGSLDAAVVALEADLGDLDWHVIGLDPFVLAAPRSHAVGRAAAPASLDDLRGCTMLLLDDGHCLRDQSLAVCTAGEAQELGFRATSLATLAQMVAGGTGITWLPRLAVRSENRRDQLAIRRFAAPAPSRTLALAWRRRSPLAAALGQIAAALRQAYEQAEPALEASLGGSPTRSAPPRARLRRGTRGTRRARTNRG